MKGWVSWMCRNSVAANLLMLLLVMGGLIYGAHIKQELFPDIQLESVSVSVVYPGAAPEEVEEGVCLPIEDAVSGIDGLKETRCTAREGQGTAIVELMSGRDVNEALQDIKTEVDRIRTFPEEAEDPTISRITRRREVLSLVVYGDLSEIELRHQAEKIRDELLLLPEITQIELSGVRPYEISVEISEEKLRKYGLSLEEVAARVREASVDVPGGTVKTLGGDVLLRTKERRYRGVEYEGLSVLTLPDGSNLKLGDIASVRDSFADIDTSANFDGKPAALIQVYRVGQQTPIEISDAVRTYIEKAQNVLPSSVHLSVWQDRSEMFRSRMNLLLRNAYFGLVLVFLVLGLFLELRLAFWVMLGIPISFLGALFIIPLFDTTINMISMFAFVLCLGIVVDDAIVVGESIYEHRRMGKGRIRASIDGALEVGTAVVFSVLTTIAAFAPMLFISGMMGKFMRVIPVIVISVLSVSLIESLFVLPSHLAESKGKALGGAFFDRIDGFRREFNSRLDGFIDGPYRSKLRTVLDFRYGAFAFGIMLLCVTVGMVRGGYIRIVHMPQVDSDIVFASLRMPIGTSVAETDRFRRRLYEKAREVGSEFKERFGGECVKHIYSTVGSLISTGSPVEHASDVGGGHLASVAVVLEPGESRSFSASEFASRWRTLVGEFPSVDSLTFRSTLLALGSNIDIELRHDDYAVLRSAADSIKSALSGFEAVSDISDSLIQGKRELKLRLRTQGKILGITEGSLGRQVRAAFYGAEALRLQRGRDEVKVMVRYPERERKSVGDLEGLRIRTPNGERTPLPQVAHVEEGVGYSEIRRNNRKRVVNITASVDKRSASPREVVSSLQSGILPKLLSRYPGLSYTLGGEQKERTESDESLFRGFIFALLLIYTLLAIPFRSYIHPLIVMTAIPFGVLGAALGHLLLGYDISILSLCGLVAMSGVVVNDSLVLIYEINRLRREGEARSVTEAVVGAACRRFRPIVMTSLTTFFGLVPIILEKSLQAQFLIPMAISLAFGVLFATFITLLLIPALYCIFEDASELVLGRR